MQYVISKRFPSFSLEFTPPYISLLPCHSLFIEHAREFIFSQRTLLYVFTSPCKNEVAIKEKFFSNSLYFIFVYWIIPLRVQMIKVVNFNGSNFWSYLCTLLLNMFKRKSLREFNFPEKSAVILNYPGEKWRQILSPRCIHAAGISGAFLLVFFSHALIHFSSFS